MYWLSINTIYFCYYYNYTIENIAVIEKYDYYYLVLFVSMCYYTALLLRFFM